MKDRGRRISLTVRNFRIQRYSKTIQRNSVRIGNVLYTLETKSSLVTVQAKEIRLKPKMKSITTALLQIYDVYLLHESFSGVLLPTTSKEFFVSNGSPIVHKLQPVSILFSKEFYNFDVYRAVHRDMFL